MRYQPMDRPDRGFVGKNWNKHYLRSMQVILQATHGVVSGAPDFLKAFGDTEDEFINILRLLISLYLIEIGMKCMKVELNMMNLCLSSINYLKMK